MKIMPMLKEDLETVYLLENLYYKSPWPRSMFIQELEENKYAHLFVAKLKDVIIGYYGFWLIMDEAMVTKITVVKPLQQKGIGLILLKDLISRCVEAGCSQISLEVRVSNKNAIRLYENQGFEKVNIRKQYYSDLEDAYTMIKILNKEESDG